jgi:hypothetical protein
MAGSYEHLINDDGGFRFDLIENMGDAYETCEDCFKIIQQLKRAAKKCGAPVEQANSKQSDAITLWKQAFVCWECNGDMNDFYLGNEKRINAVIM